MIKRFLLVFLLVGLCIPGFAVGEKATQEPTAAGEKIFTGRAEYHNLRMLLDSVADVMAGLDLKYHDARISPIVMSEQWYEFPIELGWMGTQNTLVPLLEKLLGYSFGESRLAHGAIVVSCSAESGEDGQPFLTITGMEKLMCFHGADKSPKGDPAELWATIAKRNQRVIRAIDSLLKITTFIPQVSKKLKGGAVVGGGAGKTWITNMRIDQDDRLQITGYGLEPKLVTQLGEELLKTGSFVEVYLTNMNKNVFEKVPVWRFDISARLN